MPAADDKLYGLFEEDTELLKRGKAAKPIEFGHKVLLAQTGESASAAVSTSRLRRPEPDD